MLSLLQVEDLQCFVGDKKNLLTGYLWKGLFGWNGELIHINWVDDFLRTYISFCLIPH